MDSKGIFYLIIREEFDKILTTTFNEHIFTKHNMWNYVYFLAYLLEKKTIDYTGEESYVYSHYKKSSINWIPYKRCKELNGNNEEMVMKNDLKNAEISLETVTQL